MSTSTLKDTGKHQCSEKDIYFCEEDIDKVMIPNEGPLVISTDIGLNTTISKVIIDSGSFVDVLYYDAFIKMDTRERTLEAIYGFTNIAAPIVGVIMLKTSIGSQKGRISKATKFVVVEVESKINEILRRPFIHGIKAVPSSYHQCIFG